MTPKLQLPPFFQSQLSNPRLWAPKSAQTKKQNRSAGLQHDVAWVAGVLGFVLSAENEDDLGPVVVVCALKAVSGIVPNVREPDVV